MKHTPWRRLLASASLLALLPWAAQAAPHTVNHAQPSTCAISYSVSQWAGGFTANVKVTNNGAAINGWTLAWTFPGDQRISSAWNATVTQSGQQVTAKPSADWNASLPTGGSQSFGFQATFDSFNSTPTNFTLDGAACTTDGTAPTLPPNTPTPTQGALTPTATLPSTPGIFQAEAAVLGGDTAIETTNTGYNGSGYVNFPASGGSLEFQNVSSTGGSTALRFRYALGATTARSGLLVVNGASQPITFEPTDAWTTWQTKEVVVTLNSGSNNTIRTAARRPTVYIAGDSTVQTYSARYAPQAGWGQFIANYFTGNVAFVNKAIGGRSSKSFVVEGRLDEILKVIQPNDYLFVQMGHNDATKSRPERYTDPQTTYKRYLKMYIDGARKHGAIPVLITPVGRLNYKNGVFVNDFAAYTKAMKELAAAENVKLIDLMSKSLSYYKSIGYNQTRTLFMVSVNGTDYTHFTEKGAKQIARLVSEGVREINVPISKFKK